MLVSATMSAIPMVTLVLGGARSGKSRHAEALVEQSGASAVYLATAEAGDKEMAERITVHRSRRGEAWRTVEEPLDLATALDRETDPGSVVLVDCLTLWLSNLMAADRDIVSDSAALVAVLGDLQGPVVLVSNEVGQGIVPDNALARRFRDHAGRLHQDIAAIADRVDFVTAGLIHRLK
jgi:adenosylcobinamide kinase/adenosylcobinamide-phosphate guanylyltransferase